MEKFEHPKYEIEELDVDKNYGRFVVEPLERGFGITLGNALRRVMLSSLPGGAVFSIKIDDVFHEFSSIPGVVEDVTMIILNIKSLILKIDTDEIYTLRINAKGPGVIYAKDIECPAGVEILNPDLEICTLENNASFNCEMKAKVGRGYVSNEDNKKLSLVASQGVGAIYTDSIYTPVLNANFNVVPSNLKDSVKYDKLILEVTTNGAIKAEEAVALASKILIDHLTVLTSLDDLIAESESVVMEKAVDTNVVSSRRQIEDLNLSVRSYNCLKRAGIVTVEELVQKTEDEMSKIRNLGRKSLKEIKAVLNECGLNFRKND